ncbi:integrator complex subunit 8-like isoform X1 [Biomphalaria glabrata]|uniref:Integrator complex subunit 8-like isoform X1 n=1 Tax=Biomphalaria glabrata TaxID=6526 RepID=A0A9U8E9X1_BIOGL|nr:integrator complex subunit 8-like isoform X1 [Biomphalaria glabrata]
MTDAQIPKGAQTQSPVTLPNVAWFEFILNEKLLHEHLNSENPDPSPCQLIVQFLQQAEIEMAAVIQSSNEKKTQNAIGLSANKTDEAPEIIEPTKKVKALRLLAVKVGCHLRWNLMAMEKGVPTPVLQALLILLLQICVPNVIDNIHNPDLEVTTLTELGLFVVHLFHRWCVRSVVRDSFPSKPVKQGFTALPGQVDPQVVMAQATDEIIRKFKDELPASINFLENCLHTLELESRCAAMPTSECFGLPNEDFDGQLLWSNSTKVTSQEMISQICFDLGALYFFKGDYRKSYEKFRICKQLQNELKNPVYCVVDVDRLKGYLTSCSSLLGVLTDTNIPNLFERAELTRRNAYQGMVEVFIEDNLKQELDMAYRNNVQEELLKKGLTDLYSHIYLCNAVRTAMEGKTTVLPILDILKTADSNTTAFVIQIFSYAMKGSSVLQRSNLKSFIWNLVELLPQKISFSQQLKSSDLANYFNEVELSELSLEDTDLNGSYLLDVGMEDPVAMTSYPSTRESSYNMSDIEGQLLAVYEPKLIKDILVELYENRRLNAMQIISLNDRWKVPKELKQILDSTMEKLKEFDRIYLYVLIAKARHCMELKIFERARHILLVAEPILTNTSYVAAKHVKWQMLLAELSQYTFNPESCVDLSVHDLTTQSKQCLTIIRLGQDIIPSVEVVEHCCAFLCNIGEWHYLSDLHNTGDGFIELSRLLALFVCELQTKKNIRKQARDLWETVLGIYQPGNTKRPKSAHESAVRRDQQCGILPVNLFESFIQRIKEPTVLSVLISLFSKLFSILKDDVTSEISTEYVSLWPTAIGMAVASVAMVEETLKLLLAHSLQVDPMQPSWLRTQADIYFAHGQFATAIKYYLEAGVVATDFFTCPVPRTVYDDLILRKMIKCCSYLQCHTQVAVLCQYLDEVDYNTAFKALQERNIYDAMDAYYCCIWDVSILEFLVHLHTRKGETDKRQTALRALSQMDLNSNNPDPIQRRAVHVRKTKFLRAMAKQFLG